MTSQPGRVPRSSDVTDAELPPFSTLLEQHAAALLGYLRTAVGPDDAEDCFQEAVLAALRAYGRLEHADNLRGWLFVIARRKALDSHRRRSLEPALSADPPDTAVTAGPEPPDQRLWAALARLPAGQRDAVALRVGADLGYAEVAATLGCSEPAARQRVKAGLDRLRTDGAWEST